MSSDCCCANDGCSKTAISACCLPSDACEQLRECDCLEKGGIWLERLDDGTGRGTTIPAPCDRCFGCKCCQVEDDSGALLYKGLGPPTKLHLLDTTYRCPTGTTRWTASLLDSQGGCSGTCDVPCPPEVGACCHDCGCAENVTRCQCQALVRAGGPGTQYPGGWRGQGTTCATSCEVCACVNKILATYPSMECPDLIRASFVELESCQSIQASSAALFALRSTQCSNSGGPPGGGGGGPPVTPPVPPRRPQPPPPTPPCTRPADYNPTCSYKAWFILETQHYEDPCRNYTRDYINLFRAPDFMGGDSCDTLGCCGAPIPSCTGVEEFDVRRVLQEVDCNIGTTMLQEDVIRLSCNNEQETYRYRYECPVCPDLLTTKMKIVCNTAQFLRGCCDKKMNFLQFQIPETGLKENGVWVIYYPAQTVVLDLRNKVCVGYHRNHPSCQNP